MTTPFRRAGWLALLGTVLIAGCFGIVQPQEPAQAVADQRTPTAPVGGIETMPHDPTATPMTDGGSRNETTHASTPNATQTPVPTSILTSTVTATPTATPTPTATATPTATETPAADASTDNPWGQRVVPVRINDTVGDRNTTALVDRTIAYWNEHRDRYTDFEYRFVRAENPADARVEVRFRPTVQSCNGTKTNVAGCASLLDRGTTADDLEVVEVRAESSNAAVLRTTRHEFGHLLGLDHSDEPLALMGRNYRGDIPNATDRSMPWYGDTLHVAVETDSIDGDPAVLREQVGHAVAYYDAGANGTVPENVSVVRTDEPHTAEVIVSNDSARGCPGIEGSQASARGRYLDTDPASELYTRMVVCVGSVDEKAVGWHTGYWLARGFGLSPGEQAAVFRDTDEADRNSEWWE